MLDWDDLRFFLAVARLGNLSTAARALHVSQPTVGRRLASLEANLGVRLLDRTPEGYVLSAAGREVLEKAERLEIEALALERIVGGRDTRLSGNVRVTCAEAIAAYILAPAIDTLQRQHPEILIEIISDQRDVSLSMRQADISIWLNQPSQHDLVVRRIGNLAYGLYATQQYLDSRQTLDFAGGCPDHHLIAQMDDVEDVPQFVWLRETASSARISFRTSSHEAAVSAAVGNVGLACLARFRADRESNLVRLVTPTAVPTAGIWLVVHKDNRGTTRIRAVLDFIVATFQAMSWKLMPLDD